MVLLFQLNRVHVQNCSFSLGKPPGLEMDVVYCTFRTTHNMGSAHYIVLEREIDSLDAIMDGKSLSLHIELLDKAAGELGVRPLSEFFSMPPDELADLMDGADDVEFPALQQFSAQEGLTTVRALLAHTPVHMDRIVEDLQACERILKVAAEQGVGWHFQIDI